MYAPPVGVNPPRIKSGLFFGDEQGGGFGQCLSLAIELFFEPADLALLRRALGAPFGDTYCRGREDLLSPLLELGFIRAFLVQKGSKLFVAKRSGFEYGSIFFFGAPVLAPLGFAHAHGAFAIAGCTNGPLARQTKPAGQSTLGDSDLSSQSIGRNSVGVGRLTHHGFLESERILHRASFCPLFDLKL